MLQIGFMKAFTIIQSFGALGVKVLAVTTQPKQIKQIEPQACYKKWQNLNFISSSLERMEYISTTPQFVFSQIS